MRSPFALIVLLLPALLFAQSATRALPAPNGRLNVEFSDLIAVRELNDGRVLLYDRKEERLVVADFRSGMARDVARKGQGPAEFEYVSALLPLSADTTIAADMSSRRWLILRGDSVIRTLRPDHPALQRVQLAPLGADRTHVLSRAFDAARRDSSGVILVNRASGVADTVARLAHERRRSPVRGVVTNPGQGTAARVGNIPLRSSESTLLFSDGWIAIVRLDPYRVDWRAPDGRWTLGAPLPFRVIRTSAAEKAEYIRRKPGFRNATDWPEEMPPFEAPSNLLGSPEGFVLVRRLVTRAEPGVRYDVVDRSGARRGQLLLSANQHILGFGASSVYVVTTDSDGIQRLQRHPWSTSLRP